ncbi:MAG: hypothetical protein GX334_04670 [Firmicutes bacterium]|nr:hypothetical protein [Bacillota bacterium]
MAGKRLKKNERGQSLVEISLLLPVMLLLVISFMQLAMIFSGQIVITGAAKEGVRKAVVGKADTEVKERVIAITSLLPFINLDPDQIKIEPAAAGRYENVDVTVEFPATVSILPLLERVFNKNMYTLTARAKMRCEQYPGPV